MTTDTQRDREAVEARFAEIFACLDFIAAYARRRGARDPDGIAAEVMTVAWRRLADVPADDPRPWLIVTARNLLLAERRSQPPTGGSPADAVEIEAPAERLPFELELDADLAHALNVLSDKDREALLLIAWDDLTPALAAASLGIGQTAFRVRLHRARRRLGDLLTQQASTRPVTASQPNWRQT